ncbi:hypothetical protein CTI12_AA221200 [Artemisia annua]|uniref:Helitron helicase-like domain-containing protein n=1 Tax=Artemisia annua TaxID=35608 RepID=A0A2U1NVU5_ARTAN|nr:hypothetical protein CTI12_AA221200 [Artemisia annua]
MWSSASSSSSGTATQNDRIDRNIIGEVREVLDTSSDLVQTFRRARDRYNEDSEQNIKIRLIAKRGKDGRNYNLPTTNEVAGLIVGDFDTCVEDRDIVIEKHREGLQRINIFHPMYLPLQYPLLMPRAQDGYHLGIPHRKRPGQRPVRSSESSDPIEEKKNIALYYIEQLLRSRGTTLRRWPEMPYPDDRYITEFGNRLIYDETDYNPVEMESEYQL